jgi:tRNA(Ile)-lysidine synthase
MVQKIRDFVAGHRMFRTGDKVVLGLSGGADSVCLFFVLLELREELGIEIEAVHIHHGIRGEEADRDAAFVEDLGRKNGVLVHVVRRDVPRMARERHISEEEAGREVRYQEFHRIRKEIGGQKIAVAHHRNDQAETVLYHLCRGSGLGGMAGMKPVSGVVVRPLLAVGCDEIKAYLEGRGILWCTDSSNQSEKYLRNRIRSRVLPLLEEEVNRRAVSHIAESSVMFWEAYSYIRTQGEKGFRKVSRQEADGIVLDTKGMLQEDLLIQKEMVRIALERQMGGLKDLGRVHIESVCGLLEKPAGKRVSLPGGICAVREYDGIWVGSAGAKEGTERDTAKTSAISLSIGGVYRIPGSEKQISLELLPGSGIFFAENFENSYTKWIDYDKIENNLQLRTRREGDYLVLEGGGGRKKLKNYFVDEKVPRACRNDIWLLADGSHVIWVLGYRMGSGCKITEETRRILRINWMEVTGNEGEDQCTADGRECR